MVLGGLSEAAGVAATLRAFLARRVVQFERGGAVRVRGPSQREIAARTGFPRSTLGDFLREPERASPRTVERMRALLASEAAQFRGSGQVVTYVDAPQWTRESLDNLRPPRGAQAYRIVSGTDEKGYNGYRSTGWISLRTPISALGAVTPGGYAGITRIVFDEVEE